VSFQLLPVVTITVFWDVSLCRFIDCCRHHGGSSEIKCMSSYRRMSQSCYCELSLGTINIIFISIFIHSRVLVSVEVTFVRAVPSMFFCLK